MVDFSLWDILRNLLLAARWTVLLSLIAFVGGTVVGLALLVARIAKLRGAEALVGGYVQLFQGTPLLMQLFLAYFGLALFGLNVSAWVAAALALTLYSSAFLTEMQVFTRIVLPPSLKRVWPALVSQIIIVMLGSAVCGQISTPELSHASSLIHSRNFRAFEATFIAMLLYLLLAVALRRLLNWAGPRLLFGR